MDGGAWWAIVPGVIKSQTQLSTHTHTHTHTRTHTFINKTIQSQSKITQRL